MLTGDGQLQTFTVFCCRGKNIVLAQTSKLMMLSKPEGRLLNVCIWFKKDYMIYNAIEYNRIKQGIYC